MSRVIVVQYEQFFEVEDIGGISEAVQEALDVLRGPAGARVIGSYEAETDSRFLAEAVDAITITGPVKIAID